MKSVTFVAGCEYDEVKLVDHDCKIDDILVGINAMHMSQIAMRHVDASRAAGDKEFNSLERFITAVEAGEFTATELFGLAFLGYNMPLSVKRIRAEVEAKTYAKMLRSGVLSQDASSLRSDDDSDK